MYQETMKLINEAIETKIGDINSIKEIAKEQQQRIESLEGDLQILAKRNAELTKRFNTIHGSPNLDGASHPINKTLTDQQ